MPPIVVHALSALAYAVYSFALYFLVLWMIATAGPEIVTEEIQKARMRTKAGVRWIWGHPIAFTLDFLASVALAGFLLLQWMGNSQPIWISIVFSCGVFGGSLVWWPLMIGWIVQHPIATGCFTLIVLCSALSLYFFSIAEWIQKILFFVLVTAGVVLFAPILMGMCVIVGPVIWSLLLAIAYAFRVLVIWLGFHGIARLLESVALIALGLAEYFHFYELDKNYGQLAYFGAFCGAISVGFTVLSLLPDKVKSWLGETKAQAITDH